MDGTGSNTTTSWCVLASSEAYFLPATCFSLNLSYKISELKPLLLGSDSFLKSWWAEYTIFCFEIRHFNICFLDWYWYIICSDIKQSHFTDVLIILSKKSYNHVTLAQFTSTFSDIIHISFDTSPYQLETMAPWLLHPAHCWQHPYISTPREAQHLGCSFCFIWREWHPWADHHGHGQSHAAQ